jgi:hypothetical protein
MSDWLKISVEFIRTLTGQLRSDPNAPRNVDDISASVGSAFGPDRIAVQPASPIGGKTEGTSNDRQEVGHCAPASGADGIPASQSIGPALRPKLHQIDKSLDVAAI